MSLSKNLSYLARFIPSTSTISLHSSKSERSPAVSVNVQNTPAMLNLISIKSLQKNQVSININGASKHASYFT